MAATVWILSRFVCERIDPNVSGERNIALGAERWSNRRNLFQTFSCWGALVSSIKEISEKSLFSGHYEQKVRYAMPCEEILGVSVWIYAINLFSVFFRKFVAYLQVQFEPCLLDRRFSTYCPLPEHEDKLIILIKGGVRVWTNVSVWVGIEQLSKLPQVNSAVNLKTSSSSSLS